MRPSSAATSSASNRLYGGVPAGRPARHTLSDLVGRLRAAGCVYAEEEAALIAARFPSDPDQEAAVVRRCTGTPLELVLGEVAFAGVTVVVRPGVFLPRTRAESLVDLADELGRRREADREERGQQPTDRRPVTALDLGSGTGAIAAVLSSRHPTWSVHASDVDPAAVACAKTNAERFGFAVHLSDWFDGLPAGLRGRLDVIVAHLPYVPTSHLPLIPRDYRAVEPVQAVDGGVDGLDPWRAVASAGACWLAPGGRLLTQVTADQWEGAVAIARQSRLQARSIRYDDSVAVVASRADAG